VGQHFGGQLSINKCTVKWKVRKHLQSDARLPQLPVQNTLLAAISSTSGTTAADAAAVARQ